MRVVYVHPPDFTYDFAIREALAKLPTDASDDEIAELAGLIVHFYCGMLACPSTAKH